MGENQFNFQQMKASWPSAIVARSQIGKFTGGAVAPGTLANADNQGTGPEGRFQIGRNTVYPVDSVIAWLKSKAERASRPANPSHNRR